jgi:hypothetical protein
LTSSSVHHQSSWFYRANATGIFLQLVRGSSCRGETPDLHAEISVAAARSMLACFFTIDTNETAMSADFPKKPASRFSVSLAAIALGAWAQKVSPQSGSAGSPASQTGSPAVLRNTDKDTNANKANAKVPEDGREMMGDISQANRAEIETGKIALNTGQNAQVRKFARQMIDDQTKAQNDLKKIAQTKNVRPGCRA